MDDQDQTNEVFGVSFIDILACMSASLIFTTFMVIGILAFKMGEKSSTGQAVHDVRAVTARAAELYMGDLGDAIPLDELQDKAERFRQWLRTLDPKTTIVGFHVELGGAETFRRSTEICTNENVPWIRVDEGALEEKTVSCREGKVIIDSTGEAVMLGGLTNPDGKFHQWLGRHVPTSISSS